MKATGTGYAVQLTRLGTFRFAHGDSGGPYTASRRSTAQAYLDQLRQHGVGKTKGSKVVKVRVTVETI